MLGNQCKHSIAREISDRYAGNGLCFFWTMPSACFLAKAA
jgi:hypothetical protein